MVHYGLWQGSKFTVICSYLSVKVGEGQVKISNCFFEKKYNQLAWLKCFKIMQISLLILESSNSLPKMSKYLSQLLTIIILTIPQQTNTA